MTRFGHRILSQPARDFKESIKEATLKALTKEQLEEVRSWDQLGVKISMSSNWFTKKAAIRKKDIASFEKLLTDSIFSAIEIDDSHIFELIMIKVNHEEEYIRYDLWEYQ